MKSRLPFGCSNSIGLARSSSRLTTRYSQQLLDPGSLLSTGDEVRAEVEFIAHEHVEDVVVEIYFYSIVQNLHSHFSTASEGVKLDLEKGRGIVEFFCPELPFQAASFNIEASIRHRKSDFTDHLDYKHAANIHVSKGKPVHGFYHTFHTWSVKNDVQVSQSSEVVINT